jgi:nucleoside-diphosphate-sugar epimerase
MTVLVTGGTGFVGCNIVRYLAHQGWKILAVDVKPPDDTLETFWLNEKNRIHFLKSDITSKQSVEKAVQGERIDAIVHTAAITSWEQARPESLQRMLKVNLLGNVTMLDIARSLSSVRRFLYLSSGAVYGPTSETMPIPEECDLRPSNPYALAKCASESVVRYAEGKGNLSTVILRLGWIYGPLERPTHARSHMSTIWELSQRALREEEILINDIEAVRDWTHAEDVGKAVYSLLTLGQFPHAVYNLSGGKGYPTRAVFPILEKLFPNLSYKVVPDAQANVKLNVQNRRGPLSIQRLEEDTGFVPTYDLYSGLSSYVKWLGKKGE